MPSSRLSRKARTRIIREWEDDSASPLTVPLIVILVIAMTLCVDAQSFGEINVTDTTAKTCSASFSNQEGVEIPYIAWYFSFSGDVELYPGPCVLRDDQLLALKSGQKLSEKPNQILNKHIHQLNQLKKSDDTLTWNGDVLHGWCS